MLHHEEQTDALPASAATGSEPAANVRVTAEEFARAVTRYQARREQAAQRMEGTVAIGDAVHELGLEATPEEILAEVQAERATEAARLSPLSIRPVPRRARAFQAFGIFCLVAGIPIGMFTTRQQSAGPSVMPAVQMQTPSPYVTISAAPTMLVEDNTSGKPILRTLAEIPDNVPTKCALELTASNAEFTAFHDGLSEYSTWVIIKHGGRIYVRGWISNMSTQALRTSTVNLYCRKDIDASAIAPIPVTLPLDGFQTNPALGQDDIIVAEHVQPDAHFGEHW
jgi:hypothetical protein